MRSDRRSPSGEKTRGRTETTFDVGPLRVHHDRVRQVKVFSTGRGAHVHGRCRRGRPCPHRPGRSRGRRHVPRPAVSATRRRTSLPEPSTMETLSTSGLREPEGDPRLARLAPAHGREELRHPRLPDRARLELERLRVQEGDPRRHEQSRDEDGWRVSGHGPWIVGGAGPRACVHASGNAAARPACGLLSSHSAGCGNPRTPPTSTHRCAASFRGGLAHWARPHGEERTRERHIVGAHGERESWGSGDTRAGPHGAPPSVLGEAPVEHDAPAVGIGDRDAAAVPVRVLGLDVGIAEIGEPARDDARRPARTRRRGRGGCRRSAPGTGFRRRGR